MKPRRSWWWWRMTWRRWWWTRAQWRSSWWASVTVQVAVATVRVTQWWHDVDDFRAIPSSEHKRGRILYTGVSHAVITVGLGAGHGAHHFATRIIIRRGAIKLRWTSSCSPEPRIVQGMSCRVRCNIQFSALNLIFFQWLNFSYTLNFVAPHWIVYTTLCQFGYSNTRYII